MLHSERFEMFSPELVAFFPYSEDMQLNPSPMIVPNKPPRKPSQSQLQQLSITDQQL